VVTRTAWRVADRTVSLMGAEGLETTLSKQRRQAPPLPVERALRDTRVLRTAGNVDFQLDNQVAQLVLATASPAARSADVGAAALDLTCRNQAHLAAIAEQTRRFAKLYDECAARRTDPALLAD